MSENVEKSICKDCIFDGVCRFVFDGYLLASYEYCRHFKPKSRFIELPCAVGDTIYQVAAGEIYQSTITKIIFDTENIAFDERAIGINIFLTKEEAEKALTERSEGK